MGKFGITVYALICLLNTVISSVPIGQYPSIVYAPFTPNPFLILNGPQGLQSIYCEDYKCDHQYAQTIKSNIKLFSSSLIPINYKTTPQNCSKLINNKLYYFSYYMVIGYVTLNQKTNTNAISFIVCYDNQCNVNHMNEIIIDSTTDNSYVFGYSTSLTTYHNHQTNKLYPMFTYSKYNKQLKKYVLNLIICKDFFCNSWIGKQQTQSTPPYVTLGSLSEIAKGKLSVQQIWYQKQNYLSIMFGRNSVNNSIELGVGLCSFSTSNTGVSLCNDLVDTELETKSIFKNNKILKTNDISMVEYPLSQTKSNVPIMIASYIIKNENINKDELFILYCFNIWCNSVKMLSYKIWSSQQIDYPIITIHYQYYNPSIAFFDKSYALNIMSCEYQPVPWNCTMSGYNHPTETVYQNDKFQTSKMQISITSNPYSFQQSLLIFSMVEQVQQNLKYNGSEYINCQTSVCTINQQKHIQ